MFRILLMSLFMASTAHATELSDSETSYTGATILEGDWDVTFENSVDFSGSEDRFPYAFFEGNTLYVGNSDEHNNTIDAIVEFFWFQSSIDRGTDFYVAVVKTRVTPGDDCYYAPWDWARGAQCKLWADEWSDWGEHPVLSVEALTDIGREQGAFRWDWSIPFETYGIDAYGQVTFENKYGIGSVSEGAAMAHAEYPLSEDGSIKAEGDVQVKGYHSSEYSVQTQYEITLYEWDVYVDGRADLMAWDMYLNLGARETQSAYHEYFLSIQVEEGEPFTIDDMNFIANFDVGWYDPFHHELGLTLENVTISQPYYMPASEEPEEDTPEDTGAPEDSDTADTQSEQEQGNSQDLEDDVFYEESDSKEKKGCATIAHSAVSLPALVCAMAIGFRRET